MTAREIIKKRLNHEGTDITPYTLPFEPLIYQKLTEYYKDESWEKKKLRKFMTDFFVDTVQMQPIDKVYSIDGYGAKWRMDKCLWHLEKPTFDEPSLDLSKFPSAKKFVDPILQSKAGAIVSFNDNSEQYRLIQMGWGIFEHSWRMRGFENVLMDMLTDEDFYKELTGKLTELYLAMLKACEDVPADAYLFGDDWGDQRGVIMGAKTWRKFIKPCWKRYMPRCIVRVSWPCSIPAGASRKSMTIS